MRSLRNVGPERARRVLEKLRGRRDLPASWVERFAVLTQLFPFESSQTHKCCGGFLVVTEPRACVSDPLKNGYCWYCGSSATSYSNEQGKTYGMDWSALPVIQVTQKTNPVLLGSGTEAATFGDAEGRGGEGWGANEKTPPSSESAAGSPSIPLSPCPGRKRDQRVWRRVRGRFLVRPCPGRVIVRQSLLVCIIWRRLHRQSLCEILEVRSNLALESSHPDFGLECLHLGLLVTRFLSRLQ